MKALDGPLFLDENLPTFLATLLRERGLDARTVEELGFAGKDDSPLLAYAYRERMVLITQDRDFGKLAFLSGEPYYGVVFLRPGTLDSRKILESLLAVEQIEVESPFFLVVHRQSDDSVRVRIAGQGDSTI